MPEIVAMVALLVLLVLAFQKEKKYKANEGQNFHSKLKGVIL